jgi:hypothetical protein
MVDAGHGEAAWVTRNELARYSFVRYGLGSAAGVCAVVLGATLLVRERQRKPPIKKIQDLWS